MENIDLESFPCPECANKEGNHISGDMACCGWCSLGVRGPEGTADSAALAWASMSRRVWGDPHNGITTPVKIAAVVDEFGYVETAQVKGDTEEDELEAIAAASKYLSRVRGRYFIVTRIPVSEIPEVKGVVEPARP